MHKLAPFLLAAILPPLAALHAADVPSGKLKAPTGPVAGAVLHLDASTLKLADGAAVTALANLGTGGAALDAAPTVTGQPPTFNASGNSAVIVRRMGDKQQTIKLRLSDLLKDGDICQNVEMRPGDTMIIPQSWF